MRNEKVIAFIEREMQTQDINRAELARRSGLSRPTISKLLNGNTPNPDTETLVSIARGLKKPDDTLLVLGDYIDPPTDSSPQLDEINYILSQLPLEAREDILEYARLRARINERREKSASDPSVAESG